MIFSESKPTAIFPWDFFVFLQQDLTLPPPQQPSTPGFRWGEALINLLRIHANNEFIFARWSRSSRCIPAEGEGRPCLLGPLTLCAPRPSVSLQTVSRCTFPTAAPPSFSTKLTPGCPRPGFSSLASVPCFLSPEPDSSQIQNYTWWREHTSRCRAGCGLRTPPQARDDTAVAFEPPPPPLPRRRGLPSLPRLQVGREWVFSGRCSPPPRPSSPKRSYFKVFSLKIKFSPSRAQR